MSDFRLPLLFVALCLCASARALPPSGDRDRSELSGFKTFNGKPLVELLHSYGIHISTISTMPAELERPVVDRSGKQNYAIQFASGPTKKMPCRLNEWFAGPTLPMAEFIRDGRAFPLVDPAQDDPLIYWVATGKCTKAYSY